MSIMNIRSSLHDYSVHFQQDASFMEDLKQRFPLRVFVIDERVWQLHRDGILGSLTDDEVFVFPVSENRKNLESVVQLYDVLMERSAKRNMTLISIGGGIVQDVTGFVASTIYRGIKWVFIPTTLLAQADSCIGSKTSLNYKQFKNLVGSFYPPNEIHVFAAFLFTLAEEDYFSGLGEVVKLHIMGGREKAEHLATLLPGIKEHDAAALMEAIRASLSIKLEYIADDEFDSGRRNLLNYGHCFGHALESVSKYAIPHGQAVVVGMLFANLAARSRGLLSAELENKIAEMLLMPTLHAVVRNEYLDKEALLEAMKHDKKRIGDELVIVVMKEDYSFEKLVDFTTQEALRCITVLGERLCC